MKVVIAGARKVRISKSNLLARLLKVVASCMVSGEMKKLNSNNLPPEAHTSRITLQLKLLNLSTTVGKHEVYVGVN